MTLNDTFDLAAGLGSTARQMTLAKLNQAYDAATGCGGLNYGRSCAEGRRIMMAGVSSPVLWWCLGGVAAIIILPRLLRLMFRWLKKKIESAGRDKHFARLMKPWEAYQAGMFRPKGFLLGDMARGMVRPL